MTGLDKIVAHIEKDGRSACEAVERKAQHRAQAIHEEYARQSAELERELRGEMCRRLSRMEKSRRDNMEMRERAQILDTKQALITQAFETARQSLETLDGKERVTFYTALAKKAMIPDRAGELCLTRGESSAVADALFAVCPMLRRSDRACEKEGFLLLYGAVEVDCTIETLLEQLRRTMSGKVAAVLFDGEAGNET